MRQDAEDVVAQTLQKEADWCEANQTLRDARVEARLVLQALRDADFAVMRKLPPDYVSKYPVFPGEVARPCECLGTARCVEHFLAELDDGKQEDG